LALRDGGAREQDQGKQRKNGSAHGMMFRLAAPPRKEEPRP
jgi:hypothetical protein